MEDKKKDFEEKVKKLKQDIEKAEEEKKDDFRDFLAKLIKSNKVKNEK